jgi:hypothetical protein
MTQTYRTLRVARSDEGLLSVVIDAPPMNAFQGRGGGESVASSSS